MMVRQNRLLLAATLVVAALALAATGLAQTDHHADTEQAQQTEHHPEAAETGTNADEHGAEHGEAAGEHDAEGEHGGEHGGVAHLTNWVGIIAGFLHDEHGQPSRAALLLERFKDPIFSGVTAILLMLFFARISTRRSQDPGRL